jgi:hypothetical protein
VKFNFGLCHSPFGIGEFFSSFLWKMFLLNSPILIMRTKKKKRKVTELNLWTGKLAVFSIPFMLTDTGTEIPLHKFRSMTVYPKVSGLIR